MADAAAEDLTEEGAVERIDCILLLLMPSKWGQCVHPGRHPTHVLGETPLNYNNQLHPDVHCRYFDASELLRGKELRQIEEELPQIGEELGWIRVRT